MNQVRLKYLCEPITRGSTPTYAEADDGDARVIGQSCQRPNGDFDPARMRWHTGPLPTKGMVRGGEVLINSTGTGTLGRVSLLPQVEGTVFADTHVTVVRPRPGKADSRFLAYLFGRRSFLALAEDALSVGATKQKELNVEAVRNLLVSAPSLEEQRAIADFLDRECARISDLGSPARAIGARLGEWFESVRAQAVTAGDSTRPMKAVLTDASVGIVVQPARLYTDDGEVAAIRAIDIRDERIVPTGHVRIGLEGHRAHPRSAVNTGDVLVVRSGKAGMAAVVPPALAGSNCIDLLVLRVDRSACLPEYLADFLNSSVAQDEIARLSVGSIQGHMNLGVLRDLPVRLPDLQSQQDLVREIEAARQARIALVSTTTTLEDRLDEYRDCLIHEAVMGNVDPERVSEAQMEERLHAVSEGIAAPVSI